MLYNFIETQITDCYVSPNLCQQLVIAGFDIETAYSWKIFPTVCYIDVTQRFDPDDYYTALQEVEKLNPADCILPAFSIKDCEKFLPELLLTTRQKEYTASLTNLYSEVEEAVANRLPDVFAQLLLNALKKRAISIEKIMQNYGRECTKKS